MKTIELKFSAGSSAAALGAIGGLGRLVIMGILQNSGTRFEATSFALLATGGIAAILLLTGGALGVYGAVKNDGREPAIAAIVLAGIFLVFTMSALSR